MMCEHDKAESFRIAHEVFEKMTHDELVVSLIRSGLLRQYEMQINEFEQQLAAANATIERKDKMLDLACCELEDYAERFYGHQRTKEQWLTWLEQQVKEGQ